MMTLRRLLGALAMACALCTPILAHATAKIRVEWVQMAGGGNVENTPGLNLGSEIISTTSPTISSSGVSPNFGPAFNGFVVVYGISGSAYCAADGSTPSETSGHRIEGGKYRVLKATAGSSVSCVEAADQASAGSLPSNAAQEAGGNLALARSDLDTIVTGQATTNQDLGAPGSTSCSSDIGSCNLNALLQRNNQRLSALISGGSPALGSNGGALATDIGNRLQMAGSDWYPEAGRVTCTGSASYTPATGTITYSGVGSCVIDKSGATVVGITNGTGTYTAADFYSEASAGPWQAAAFNINTQGSQGTTFSPSLASTTYYSLVTARYVQLGATAVTGTFNVVVALKNYGVSFQSTYIGGVAAALPTLTSGTFAGFTGSSSANTFTQVLAANSLRKNCTIYSANAFSVAPGVSPTSSIAIQYTAGSTFKCSDFAMVVGEQINVSSPTVSNPYAVWSW